MMKTDNYDPKNIEHVSLYEGFEYSCGMVSITFLLTHSDL